MKYFKKFVQSNRNLLLLLVLIITNSKKLQPQELYSVMIDQTFSMPVGAQNLLTIHQLTYSFENTVLPLRVFEESSTGGKAAGVSYRLGKTVLLDFPFDYFVCVIQHEVFGHGSRMREYEFQDIKYQFILPPPYGGGGGMTWGNPPVYYSNDENLAMIIGGVESTSMLSEQLIKSCIQKGEINSREAFLYTLSSNGLVKYLWQTQHESSHSESNDMVNYEEEVNGREGFYDHRKLTVDDLTRQAIISEFLDPFQYISLFSFFKIYLWGGENTWNIPMIHMGNVKYLPAFHFGLTPFGSELYLENYFMQSEHVLELYVRYGIPTFHKTWGLGCNLMNLLQTDNVTIGSTIDLWNQPALESYTKSNTLVRSGTGGAISISANVKVIDTFASIHWITEFKTKTAGYLRGEPLADAFLWREGLQFVTR